MRKRSGKFGPIVVTPAVEARLWSKVDKAPGHGPWGDCWIWTGHRNANGYGIQEIKDAPRRASRVSFIIANPGFDQALNVLHRCDNPPCVRPSHLFAGTQIENIADMVAKGRAAKGASAGARTRPECLPRGERHPSAKLTAQQVLKIREMFAAGARSYVVARMFGVSQVTVWQIRHGKSWMPPAQSTNAQTATR